MSIISATRFSIFDPMNAEPLPDEDLVKALAENPDLIEHDVDDAFSRVIFEHDRILVHVKPVANVIAPGVEFHLRKNRRGQMFFAFGVSYYFVTSGNIELRFTPADWFQVSPTLELAQHQARPDDPAFNHLRLSRFHAPGRWIAYPTDRPRVWLTPEKPDYQPVARFIIERAARTREHYGKNWRRSNRPCETHKPTRRGIALSYGFERDTPLPILFDHAEEIGDVAVCDILRPDLHWPRSYARPSWVPARDTSTQKRLALHADYP